MKNTIDTFSVTKGTSTRPPSTAAVLLALPTEGNIPVLHVTEIPEGVQASMPANIATTVRAKLLEFGFEITD